MFSWTMDIPLSLVSTHLSQNQLCLRGGGGGGGVQGQKSWKHDFEIAGDPKGSLSGSTFWLGFEAPNS